LDDANAPPNSVLLVIICRVAVEAVIPKVSLEILIMSPWPALKSVMWSTAAVVNVKGLLEKAKVSAPKLPVSLSTPAFPSRMLAEELPTIVLLQILPVPLIALAPVRVKLS